MMRRRRGLGVIGAAAVVGGAHHMGVRSAERNAAEQQQDAAIADLQSQQYAAQPAVPAPSDDAAQIQKYAALKGQGLITEEEFEAKKKQILGI